MVQQSSYQWSPCGWHPTDAVGEGGSVPSAKTTLSAEKATRKYPTVFMATGLSCVVRVWIKCARDYRACLNDDGPGRLFIFGLPVPECLCWALYTKSLLPGSFFPGLSLGEYLSIPRHGTFNPDLSASNQHLRSPSFAQASFLFCSPHDDGFDLIRCHFVLKTRRAGRISSKRKK